MSEPNEEKMGVFVIAMARVEELVEEVPLANLLQLGTMDIVIRLFVLGAPTVSIMSNFLNAIRP